MEREEPARSPNRPAAAFRVTGALPRPRSSLLGREAAVEDISRRLADERLVTLTGPGGVGKTRIALELAHRELATRTRGVAVVDLSVVTEPDFVADAVREALGLPENPTSSALQVVVDGIGSADLVLVADNCEHLVDAVVDVLDQLLTSCPRLSVLATSREPLALDGESVWPVPPLELPGVEVPDLEEVRASAATRLFEQRASAVVPGFELTESNAATVAALCQRVDGLPLAIELAAARVRVLSVEQILTGLDDVFVLLVGGTRSTPPRQQSLRASLDWSHRLLGEPERRALRRLGVFPGGFDLPAASAVVTFGGHERLDVLDLLVRLTDRSLVTTYPFGDAVRYRLLAPVREYARERLAESAEEVAAGHAHLEHFASFTEAIEPHLLGSREAEGLDALELEGSNLRAALSYAADHDDPRPGMRLITGLSRLCIVRGHYREGRRWLDWAAAVDPGAPPELMAKALLGGGSLAFLQCDYPAAVRRLERCLQLYRELDDQAGVTAALHGLGGIARARGRYARAEGLYRESLAVADGAGDDLAVAQARLDLGVVAWLQCLWSESESQTTAALDTYRRLGSEEGVIWAWLSLGLVAAYRGDHIRALPLLEQARDHSAQLHFPEGLAWSAHELGRLAAGREDPQAELLLVEALSGYRALGDQWRTARVVEDLATLRLRGGSPERAVELLGAASGIRSEIGSELAPCEWPEHDLTEELLRGAMSPEAFARAWGRGQASGPDELVGPAVRADPRPAEREGGDPARRAGAPTGSALAIRALGECSVLRDGQPLTAADWAYGKPRELLFLLVSSTPLSKSRIGQAIWPELDAHQLRNPFHTALRDLRRALGDPGWVVFAGGRYTFDRHREYSFDLEVFDEALAAARLSRSADVALPHLERAIAAYTGDFGVGLPDSPWVHERREDLRRSYGEALSATGRILATEGEGRRAVELFRRLVQLEPLDEAAHRQLMRALDSLGETGLAARLYDDLVDRLRSELAVDPAPQTRAVREALDRS
jgi:predicted ATPase/DNA-binding SARP family transcriptional activator